MKQNNVKSFNGMVIDVATKTIIGIEDVKEVYICGVKDINESCLINRPSLKAVFVCNETTDQFNVSALIKNLIQLDENEQDKSLLVFLPTQFKNELLNNQNVQVKDFARYHLANSKITIVFANIDQPDDYLE